MSESASKIVKLDVWFLLSNVDNKKLFFILWPVNVFHSHKTQRRNWSYVLIRNFKL
jgi:hypothetical protein